MIGLWSEQVDRKLRNYEKYWYLVQYGIYCRTEVPLLLSAAPVAW